MRAKINLCFLPITITIPFCFNASPVQRSIGSIGHAPVFVMHNVNLSLHIPLVHVRIKSAEQAQFPISFCPQAMAIASACLCHRLDSGTTELFAGSVFVSSIVVAVRLKITICIINDSLMFLGVAPTHHPQHCLTQGLILGGQVLIAWRPTLTHRTPWVGQRREEIVVS